MERDKLYGQFTRFACLVDKEADFREELRMFAPIAELVQPAITSELFKNF